MPSDQSPHKLGTEPIGKLLVEYSLPAIIAMTIVSLYHVIDSIFIGHGVGAMAIAGLAVTFPLMNLVIAFSTLVGVGSATISSIYMGQKDIQRATLVLHNAFILLLVDSVVISTVAYIFLDPILYFFGSSSETLPYARDFMQVILIINPISYLFIGLNNLMRATGYPKKAMISSFFTVAVNVIVAPIFIFVLKLGIRGAAMATGVAQTVGLVWVLFHFLNKKSFIHIQKGYFKLSKRIIISIFSIGMSPFLLNTCSCIVVIIINASLQRYGGDMAIGAYGIVNRMLALFGMVVLGLTQGMQPIIGYNYGANRFDRVKQTLRYGLFFGGCITTVGFLAHELIPGVIVGLFTDSPELLEISRTGLRIMSAVFFVVGMQIVITQFFQSIGKSKISIFLSLSRQLLFFIPCLLTLPRFYGTTGVWCSLPVADGTAFVIAVIALLYHFHKVSAKMKEVRQA
ncbi:MAG: MATE family efflux transporter [Porphyromonadaceae bacterium]|nr:MATE family efflux transporter [Porphyromonadaceae bacterium]